MSDVSKARERKKLLAAVAEMYYQQELSQSDIARRIDMSPSMVSRLLSQARELGIVEFRIHHPLEFDTDLEAELTSRFNLRRAHVFIDDTQEGDHILSQLGKTAAEVLNDYLDNHTVLGIGWGTAVHATVKALSYSYRLPIEIVQLTGSMGVQYRVYDGHVITQKLAEKLGADAFYINAPLIVQSPLVAKALREDPSIKQALEHGRFCTLALIGIGTTDPEISSFCKAGYLSKSESKDFLNNGIVGEICGHHFDSKGDYFKTFFTDRVIGIHEDDFMKIPNRLGVATGLRKVNAVLGALQGGWINILVTDNGLATEVLKAVQGESSVE